MKLTVLAFAGSKDDFGFSEMEVVAAEDDTPREVVNRIAPGMDVSSLRVALDCEFADWDAPLGITKEMALIPPVSGG